MTKKNIEQFRLEASLSQTLEQVASEHPRLNKTLVVEIALDHLLNGHSAAEVEAIAGQYLLRSGK